MRKNRTRSRQVIKKKMTRGIAVSTIPVFQTVLKKVHPRRQRNTQIKNTRYFTNETRLCIDVGGILCESIYLEHRNVGRKFIHHFG